MRVHLALNLLLSAFQVGLLVVPYVYLEGPNVYQWAGSLITFSATLVCWVAYRTTKDLQ